MTSLRCVSARDSQPEDGSEVETRHRNLESVHSGEFADVYRCLDCGELFCVDLFESAQLGVRYTVLSEPALAERHWSGEVSLLRKRGEFVRVREDVAIGWDGFRPNEQSEPGG